MGMHILDRREAEISRGRNWAKIGRLQSIVNNLAALRHLGVIFIPMRIVWPVQPGRIVLCMVWIVEGVHTFFKLPLTDNNLKNSNILEHVSQVKKPLVSGG